MAWALNKKERSGDWKVVGYDRGGMLLTLICRYYPNRRLLRPITGWPTTAGERAKYL